MKHIAIISGMIALPLLLAAQDATSEKQKTDSMPKKPAEVLGKSPVAKKDCCCESLPAGCKVDGATYTEPISTITVDFSARNNAIPKGNFKRGTPVRVRVVNYNPYLYKVAVDTKDSTVAPSGDIKPFTWFIDPANLSALSAGLSALNVATPGISDEKYKSTLPFIEYSFSTRSRPKSKDVLQEERKKVKNTIEKYKPVVEKLRGEIDTLNSEIEQSLYATSKELDFLYELTPSCEKFTSLDNTVNKIEKNYTDRQKLVRAQKKAVKLSSDKYIIDFAGADDVASTEPSYKIGDSLIRRFYSEAIVLLNKMDSTLNYIELRRIISQLNSLKVLRTCYTSLPIYFASDIKKFTIELSPWKDSMRLPSYSTSFDLPWRKDVIYGVSAGLYASGLHNRGYSNQRSKTDTSNFNLVSDNPGGGLEYGINSLAYMARRISKTDWFFGGTIGAGMSIESKPKPRAFAGIDFIYGETNRVVISVGFVGGYVQRLSKVYDTNTTYRAPQTGYMKDYLKGSAYFAVHYSFLSR